MIKIKIKSRSLSEQQTGNNAEYNIQYMLKNKWPPGEDFGENSNIADSIYEEEGYDDEELEEELLPTLISNMPPLKNNRIVKAITGKSFGKILKLSNGHILKIFKDGINPEDDYQWYKESHDKMFMGSADLNTLPIFDVGKADRGDFIEIYFAEMAELVPLGDWIDSTKRGLGKGASAKDSFQFNLKLENAVDAIAGAYKMVQSDYENERNETGRKPDRPNPTELTPEQYADAALEIANRKKFVYEPFTPNEFKAIVVAALKMERSGRALSDFSARNLAIMPRRDESNPIVIIFDK